MKTEQQQMQIAQITTVRYAENAKINNKKKEKTKINK